MSISSQPLCRHLHSVQTVRRLATALALALTLAVPTASNAVAAEPLPPHILSCEQAPDRGACVSTRVSGCPGAAASTRVPDISPVALRPNDCP